MTPRTSTAPLHVVDTSVIQDSRITFSVPAEDPHFVVSPQQKSFLRGVARLARKDSVNVGVRGPKGTGKTTLAQWFAAKTNRPLCIVDVPTLREPKDLYGYKDVQRGADGTLTIRHVPSAFLAAVETSNAVILLDEATRVHASVLNTLLPLLDHRRSVWLDELGRVVTVAPGVIFFLTANIGLEYTGTWQWDAALEDRLQYQIEVNYLARTDEVEVLINKTGVDRAVAERLAEVAELVRRRVTDANDPLPHAISTRQLIATARLCAEGIEPSDALEFTVIPTYSADGGESSARANVLAILQGKLGR
jgi:MoxR-like ATPase